MGSAVATRVQDVQEESISTDRFGNAFVRGLPYARGQILTSTEDDFRKVQEAWRHIAGRVRAGGPEAIY